MEYTINPIWPTLITIIDVEEDTDELMNHNDFQTSYANLQNKLLSEEYNDLNITPFGRKKRLLEQYPRIRDILLDKFKYIARTELGYKERDYLITTSWLTINPPGGSAQLHCHRNSFWSAVYYYHDNYDDDSGEISFENPLEDKWDFFFDEPDIETTNEFNAGCWRFKPQKKKLILFPSYLRHSVCLNESNDIRYSLAFNIVPLGVWGNVDSTYDMAWSSPKYFSNLADKE
tara:strand:+ start:201 stop:893 length:693 start_codon:yes stop_codon:yes gene_type:complete